MTSAEIHTTIHAMGNNARQAAYALGLLSAGKKNAILRAMAAAVRGNTDKIIAANSLDLAAATEKGLSAAMIDRLRLDATRLEAIAAGIEQVASQIKSGGDWGPVGHCVSPGECWWCPCWACLSYPLSVVKANARPPG